MAKILSELSSLNNVYMIITTGRSIEKARSFMIDNKNVHFVALVGQDEMAGGIITLRNMKNGDQEKLNIKELIFRLSSHS